MSLVRHLQNLITQVNIPLAPTNTLCLILKTSLRYNIMLSMSPDGLFCDILILIILLVARRKGVANFYWISISLCRKASAVSSETGMVGQKVLALNRE